MQISKSFLGLTSQIPSVMEVCVAPVHFLRTSCALPAHFLRTARALLRKPMSMDNFLAVLNDPNDGMTRSSATSPSRRSRNSSRRRS